MAWTLEEQRAYHREWYRKNRERLRQKYQENIEAEREKRRAYVEANREQIRAYQARYRKTKRRTPQDERRYRLRREYGISELRYRRLCLRQDWMCLICDEKPDPDGPLKLVIDHDHGTGRIRGLLCRKCNTGLGYFRDNPNFLRHAAAYLKKVTD